MLTPAINRESCPFPNWHPATPGYSTFDCRTASIPIDGCMSESASFLLWGEPGRPNPSLRVDLAPVVASAQPLVNDLFELLVFLDVNLAEATVLAEQDGLEAH